MYIWTQPDWPNFYWDERALRALLETASRKQGHLLGRMHNLGLADAAAAQLETLTEDIVKSSEIEGEQLERSSVRSSVSQRLGIANAAYVAADAKTEGVVEMMLDATQGFDRALSEDRLQGWQSSLFPGGRSGMRKIIAANWRNDAEGPMQVVSGAIGHEHVHYQAPPANRLSLEMQRFLQWFEEKSPDSLLRAGLAHLWFVTIHPFEDGNGRIARAIADQALAQLERSPQRFYSMSSQIRKERRAYYEVLESTQKGSLDITNWLSWFLHCFAHAIDGAEQTCAVVLHKANFWRIHQSGNFSERQRKVLNRYLDGFDGKLTTRKWAAVAKISLPSAQRDINDLLELGVLRKNQGGSKNTSYEPLI